MVQVLIVGYFVDVGYSPMMAATTVGLSGMAASLGMVLFGWLSDRIGYLGTLTATVGVTAIGLTVLATMMWVPSPWLLALHVESPAGRGPPLGPLARLGQDRMRHPHARRGRRSRPADVLRVI